MTAYGPKAHLASAVINWGPYYVQTVRNALEGKNASTQSWWGVKEGAIDIVSMAETCLQKPRPRWKKSRPA